MKKIVAYPEHKSWRTPQIFGDEKLWLALNHKTTPEARKNDSDGNDIT